MWRFEKTDIGEEAGRGPSRMAVMNQPWLTFNVFITIHNNTVSYGRDLNTCRIFSVDTEARNADHPCTQ